MEEGVETNIVLRISKPINFLHFFTSLLRRKPSTERQTFAESTITQVRVVPRRPTHHFNYTLSLELTQWLLYYGCGGESIKKLSVARIYVGFIFHPMVLLRNSQMQMGGVSILIMSGVEAPPCWCRFCPQSPHLPARSTHRRNQRENNNTLHLYTIQDPFQK